MKKTLTTALIILTLTCKGQFTISPEIGIENNIETGAYFTLRFGYEYYGFTMEAVILPPMFNYINPAYLGLSTGYQFFVGDDNSMDLLDKNDTYFSITPLLLTYYRLNDLDKPKGYNGNRYVAGAAFRFAYKSCFLQASYVDNTSLFGIGLKAILK